LIVRSFILTILTVIVFGSALLCGLTGCSVRSPIQPASSSKSAFDGADYKGETVTLYAGTAGNEAYRVFNQAAIGCVCLQSVRDDAQQRARDFCDRRGKSMEPIRETTSTPPYILGKVPRVEIVFDCVDKPTLPRPSTIDDPKYARLLNLKKLLDVEVTMGAEFPREKDSVPSSP